MEMSPHKLKLTSFIRVGRIVVAGEGNGGGHDARTAAARYRRARPSSARTSASTSGPPADWEAPGGPEAPEAAAGPG